MQRYKAKDMEWVILSVYQQNDSVPDAVAAKAASLVPAEPPAPT